MNTLKILIVGPVAGYLIFCMFWWILAQAFQLTLKPNVPAWVGAGSAIGFGIGLVVFFLDLFKRGL